MTEKEMIEKIRQNLEDINGMKGIRILGYIPLAEELVKQGYRKIPEGSVVLTKDEWARLRNLEINYDDAYEHYLEYEIENQQLKDRIAELGKENAELKVDLKNSIDMQKQMLDGFKTAIKEVEENLAREIPNLLKQFAEMLKEKAVYFGKHDCEHNAVKVRTINETLKKFININKGENNE